MANKPLKTLNFGSEDTYYLAPDFKNIDNSPFETSGGDTLTWDGNTEGRVGTDYLGVGYNITWHVTDITPTLAELENGASVVIGEPGASDTLELAFHVINDQILASDEWVVIVALVDNATAYGITFEKKGLYLLNDTGWYVQQLTINGYTGFGTTKLKEEYIPEGYINQLITEATVTEEQYNELMDLCS